MSKMAQRVFICENCGKKHNGEYGSGRFCSKHCRLSYIGKVSYKKKVAKGTFRSNLADYNKFRNHSEYGTWTCDICSQVFTTRRELYKHLAAVHGIRDAISLADGNYQCPYCHCYTGKYAQVHGHMRACSFHPNKEKHNIARKKQGKTLSKKIKSGEIIPSFLGKHHSADAKKKIAAYGGKRIHSGRGKQGLYQGIWCDSSWELAWVIYQLEHDIAFKRCNKHFSYVFQEKTHEYYPDFELPDGTFVEIKGYKSPQWLAKCRQFPKDKKLVILGRIEIQPYLKYAQQKYGKNFIELYEKRS